MPFRTSAKTKAKAKKKSLKNKAKDRKRNDGWDFDGGVSQQQQHSNNNSSNGDDDNDSSEGSGHKRKFRRTQQQDDKRRRLAIREEINKKKREFTNKMSKKLKFSDFLEQQQKDKEIQQKEEESESEEEDDNTDAVEAAAAAAKKQQQQQRRNPLSLTQRLQHYVTVALQKRTAATATAAVATNDTTSDAAAHTATAVEAAAASLVGRDISEQEGDALLLQQQQQNDNIITTATSITTTAAADDDDDDEGSALAGNFDAFFQSSEFNSQQQQQQQQQQLLRERIVDASGAEFELTAAVADRFKLPLIKSTAATAAATAAAVRVKRGGVEQKQQQQQQQQQQQLRSWSGLQEMPGLNKMFRHIAQQQQQQQQQSEVDSFAFGPLSSKLVPCLSTFADAFIEGRDACNDADLQRGLLAHAAAHVVKARARVLKHNQHLKRKQDDARITATAAVQQQQHSGADLKSLRKKERKALEARRREEIAAASSNNNNNNNSAATTATAAAMNADVIGGDVDGDDNGSSDRCYRDQGFTRPRLLILCAFRSSAFQILAELRQLLGDNTSISGWDKLVDEFTLSADEEDSDEDARNAKKPADWRQLFHRQNVDDDFKLGVQVNPGSGKGSGAGKGVYLRLFSEFFISDIIIASPIGLRLAIERGASSEQADNSNSSKGNSSGNSGKDAKQRSHGPNADFLSSLEMVLLHQADVLYMQNWEHVQYVLQHCNQLPRTVHPDTDFSRVRQYVLDGNASSRRQLLLNAAFAAPELAACFREHARSCAGSVRLRRRWPADGALADVFAPAKQVFQIVPAVKDFMYQEDVRFEYFRDQVLAPILRIQQQHTLIVTPSYLSFVRVRNELINQDASAAFVSEYSRDSEISRGRARFFNGQKHILLYSGRAHFFRRYVIRGARHLIFYSLPDYAHFYSEFVNMLSDSTTSTATSSATTATTAATGAETQQQLSCLVLCTPFEKLALQRIVGLKRCERMLTAAQHTFMFC